MRPIRRIEIILFIELIILVFLSSASSPSESFVAGIKGSDSATEALAETIQRSKDFQQWSNAIDNKLTDETDLAPGRRNGAKEVVKRLMHGSTLIFRDVMEWRRLKDTDDETLPYETARRLKETPVLALRIAPLLVNPLPPPFGIVLLCIANTMPRTLLTHHFYSDAQCESFAAMDSWDTHRRFKKILVRTAAAAAAPSPPVFKQSASAVAAAAAVIASAGAADDNEEGGDDVDASIGNGNSGSGGSKLEAFDMAQQALHALLDLQIQVGSGNKGDEEAFSERKQQQRQRRCERLAGALVDSFSSANNATTSSSSLASINTNSGGGDDGGGEKGGAGGGDTYAPTDDTSRGSGSGDGGGTVGLEQLEVWHLRSLLKATAAACQATGLPDAPGFSWTMQKIKSRASSSSCRRLLEAHARALEVDNRKLLLAPLATNTEASALSAANFCDNDGESSTTTTTSGGGGGGGSSAVGDVLDGLSDARLRVACLERGLLFSGQHDLAGYAAAAASVRPSSSLLLRVAPKQKSPAIAAAAVFTAAPATADLRVLLDPAGLKRALAELSGSPASPPPASFVRDPAQMRARLRRYLTAVSLLSEAAHPHPIPPSLVLHLPVLLAI